MCNLYRLQKSTDAIVALVRALELPLAYPEGLPNFEPRDVRITERAPILRAASESTGAELVQRRWSWPGAHGKPVFNFRAEGRRFAQAERCVVLADGFYEYTAPSEPGRKAKDRWLFTWPDHAWFGIAGIVRPSSEHGEAFTLLTCPPGADIAPFHARQVVLLGPHDFARWLGADGEQDDLLGPLPPGSLKVERA